MEYPKILPPHAHRMHYSSCSGCKQTFCCPLHFVGVQICSNVSCHGNKSCTAKEVCECIPGFTGPNCSVEKCELNVDSNSYIRTYICTDRVHKVACLSIIYSMRVNTIYDMHV